MLVSQIPFLAENGRRDGTFENLGKLNANKEKLLSFCNSEKYIKEANANMHLSCVITTEEYASAFRDDINVICSEEPKNLFYQLHDYLATSTDFYIKETYYHISNSASIHPSSVIASDNVFIGENVQIGPNVTIYENVKIQDDVVIKAGAVIGSDGFEAIKTDDKIFMIKHVGGVILEKSVAVGANVCIDKALFEGNTVIGEETKMDNQIHIAHNCQIGKRCFITAGVCMGGNVSVGDNTWIAPNATIINNIVIGKNVFIGMGSFINKSIEDDKVVAITPARVIGSTKHLLAVKG